MNSQPRKRGKKYALKQARKMPSTKDGDDDFRDFRDFREPRPTPLTKREILNEKIFNTLNDSENYPLFSWIDESDVADFVNSAIAVHSDATNA